MSAKTLIDRFWTADEPAARALRVVLLAVVGSALLTVSAKVQIPFWPVPVTMQTFVVMVLGLGYGLRLGTATVALYLAQGALGMPVFAGGGGIAYFTGPTAGYLVGFLVAAALLGWLAERGWHRTVPRAIAAALAGDVVMFALGWAWLAVLAGPVEAFASGVLPFLLGDALKVLGAGLAVAGVHRLAERRSRSE